MRQLFADIFDLDPLAHTMAMYATVCNGVDFLGLHQPASDPEEEAHRNRYKSKNRHLFVELSLLTWKYRVNIDPVLEDRYKEKVFDGWRNMPTDDVEYLGIIGAENSSTVPVPCSTAQNMVKSLITNISFSPVIYLTSTSLASELGLSSP